MRIRPLVIRNLVFLSQWCRAQDMGDELCPCLDLLQIRHRRAVQRGRVAVGASRAVPRRHRGAEHAGRDRV